MADDAEDVTRDQIRSRRRRDVRSKTVSVKRLSKTEIEKGRAEYPEPTAHLRPKTRGECVGGPRPCPFISCSHHLYLDVSPQTGAIKLNFPDLEPEEMRESCSLDVADRDGATLEEVGAIMNLTRERIRQCDAKALAKIQAVTDLTALREIIEDEERGKPRRHLHLVRDEAESDYGKVDPNELEDQWMTQ